MTNIVLVTVDSLRADRVGCYGHERDTSPTVDALADEGLQFDGYANAHATRASFPAILTGTYPLEFGGAGYMSEGRSIVAEPLSAAGYHTGGFHSNLWLSRDYGYDRGFDHFYDSKSDPSLLARLRSWVKLNVPQDSAVYGLLQRLYDTTEEKAGVNVGNTYQDAEVITDRAVDWLADADESFFCWVHYMDVHHPYVPRTEAAASFGLDLDCSQQEAIRLRRKMLEEPGELTDAEHRTILDLYDAEIRYTDREIGRLLDAVDRHTDEETAVVLTADHGEELGDHGAYGHSSTMYDEILHVPFVVSPPESAELDPARAGEAVELLDVPPTVCDLAGVEPPETYRGRSALDRLGTGDQPAVISETDLDEEYKLSLRADGWKYIWDRETERTELYDLDADPGETDDVVETASERAESMRETLTEHLGDLRATNESVPEVSMDATTEERLRDLGYLE
ncbi:sulfatase [Haloarcula litorea]|uniref:sulfatase n=1 Tax=Haloarcula litorea TaxID=3032579 RepID=UPI0023E842C2|nr:sulfatase [Halomicroarcula sp. GDY20]